MWSPVIFVRINQRSEHGHHQFTNLIESLQWNLSFQGMSDGLIGPSLPSLADRASVGGSEMSTIYTWRACFAMAGSLLIGHMLDKFDPAVVLAVSLFFQAAFASVAPWLNHLLAISAVSALSAFFNGGINAGKCTVDTLRGRTDFRWITKF